MNALVVGVASVAAHMLEGHPLIDQWVQFGYRSRFAFLPPLLNQPMRSLLSVGMTMALHPSDAAALQAVIGPRTPGHRLILAGLVVAEDERCEAPIVRPVKRQWS